MLKCKTLPKVEDMLFLLECDLAAQQAVVVEEIGIGLVDGLGAVDHDLAGGTARGDGGHHGDAMVVVRIDLAAGKGVDTP